MIATLNLHDTRAPKPITSYPTAGLMCLESHNRHSGEAELIVGRLVISRVI